MRTHAAILAAGLLGLGLYAASSATRAARADDETTDLPTLAKQVRLLRVDVDYLLSREAALTKGALAAEAVAKDAASGAQDARAQGFESAGPNPMSKTTILRTLESIARDLNSALPKVTKEESALKGAADAMRRELGAK